MTAALYPDFPCRFASDGLTARTDRVGYVRDLLEQLLLTRPGERLTRPAFGCGLADLLFAPLAPEHADAVRTMIQVAVQEHLAREIVLTTLDVAVEGSTLRVDIGYRILATGETGEAGFGLEASP